MNQRLVTVVSCLLAPALALAVLPAEASALATAQWADTAHQPGGAIVGAAGFVLHADGSAWQGFGAANRRWQPVADVSDVLVAYGSRVALFDRGEAQLVWSAFDGRTALLENGSAVHALAEGDVALVVTDGMAGPVAHAFSALTGGWSSVALEGGAIDANEIALGDAVIALRDGVRYLGFAARTGTWSALETPTNEEGNLPFARGEVALAPLRLLGGGGVDRMAAFSGVLGIWDVSELLHFSSSTHIGRHVALVRVQHPILTRFYASGYSAYTGRWTTDTAHVHTTTVVVQYGGESIVVIENLNPAFNLTAFGARPGVWSTLTGSRVVLSVEGDTAIAENPLNGALAGASGLRAGWALVAGTAPHGVAPGSDHLALILDSNLNWRTFSPATRTFSAPAEGIDYTNSAAVAGLIGADGRARGGSPRGGTWVDGPLLAPGSTMTATGSILAWADGASGELTLFDGRTSQLRPAPAELDAPQIHAAEQLLVAVDGGAPGNVYGYSARRGDWTLAGSGALPTPFAAPVEVLGDVAWLVDGNQRLWAFGAGRDAELAHDWPDGPGFHLPAPTTGEPASLRLALSGAPAELAVLLAAPTVEANGVSLPPLVGVGFLPVTGTVTLAVQSLAPTGTANLNLPLPAGVAPGTRVWLQSVHLDLETGTLRFGAGVADAWLF